MRNPDINTASKLKSQLADSLEPVLKRLGFDSDGVNFRLSNQDSADFQCEIALRLARVLKKSPRDIAIQICNAAHDSFSDLAALEVSGPGFINARLTDDALIARLESVGNIKTDDTQTIFMDFGGPNVAKPMHVGHLRSAVIGDTLQRIFRFCGDNVVSDIHLGDWGLQMGHIITQLEVERPDLPHFNKDWADTWSDPGFDMKTLAELYPRGAQAAKDDPSRMATAQQAASELQGGRAGYRALIDYCIRLSVAALKKDYAFLNVHFDLWRGEKDVGGLVHNVVNDFEAKNLVRQSDGAKVVDIARDGENIATTDKKVKNPMPPLMLLNSRGGSGYHATDLATIKDRLEVQCPDLDRIIYVVDQRQALHFQQVFRAAEKVGYLSQDRLEFIGFGTVNGTDGKPFKTREGGVLRLSDLHQQALEQAGAKMAEANMPEGLTQEAYDHIKKCVAVAAIRFADLSNTRLTNYVFDLERFTKFQGKTGPYLLYQAVRIKSLLRKTEVPNADGDIILTTESERALALALDGFEDAVLGSRQKRMPHILCEYLFELSQSLSVFYTENPILSAPNEKLKNSRLLLCQKTLEVLETGLDLIGVEIPDRM